MIKEIVRQWRKLNLEDLRLEQGDLRRKVTNHRLYGDYDMKYFQERLRKVDNKIFKLERKLNG